MKLFDQGSEFRRGDEHVDRQDRRLASLAELERFRAIAGHSDQFESPSPGQMLTEQLRKHLLLSEEKDWNEDSPPGRR